MAADEDAIRAVIAAQFAALSWAPGQPPDYTPLLQGFLAEARLFHRVDR